VVIDRVDRVRHVDRDRMPAPLRGVLGVEVVGRVCAGTLAVLDNVLVVVADDDGEIAVALDPSSPTASMARFPRSPCSSTTAAAIGPVSSPASAIAACQSSTGSISPSFRAFG